DGNHRVAMVGIVDVVIVAIAVKVPSVYIIHVPIEVVIQAIAWYFTWIFKEQTLQIRTTEIIPCFQNANYGLGGAGSGQTGSQFPGFGHFDQIKIPLFGKLWVVGYDPTGLKCSVGLKYRDIRTLREQCGYV